MFEKKGKKIILFLTGLVIAFSGTVGTPDPCALIKCSDGTKCVNGKCSPIQQKPLKEAIPIKTHPCFPKLDSPFGCLEDCSSKAFSSCPKNYPNFDLPRYCAYNKNKNQWKSFTFACQACTTKGVTGFKKQKCGCTILGCKDKQVCNPKTDTCQSNLKCSNTLPKKVTCNQRPTKKECPDLQYIKAPQLNFCGIDKNGNKKGFARGCQVCLNNNFYSYYPVPCHKVPQIICKSNQICASQGKCIPIVLAKADCSKIKCKQGEQCKYGICIKIQIPKQQTCLIDKDCKNNEICSNKICLNKCATVKCSSGFHCINGSCFPSSKP